MSLTLLLDTCVKCWFFAAFFFFFIFNLSVIYFALIHLVYVDLYVFILFDFFFALSPILILDTYLVYRRVPLHTNVRLTLNARSNVFRSIKIDFCGFLLFSHFFLSLFVDFSIVKQKYISFSPFHQQIVVCVSAALTLTYVSVILEKIIIFFRHIFTMYFVFTFDWTRIKEKLKNICMKNKQNEFQI